MYQEVVVAAGCAFTDFDTYAVAGTYTGSTASLVDCVFEGNTMYPLVWGAAVFEAESDAQSGPVSVRLQGCTFDNTLNSVPTLLRDKRDKVAVVEFYSDSPTPEVCTYEGADESAEPPPCIITPPLPLEQAGNEFLTLANPWLVETQLVRHPSWASGCFSETMKCSFVALRPSCIRNHAIYLHLLRFPPIMPMSLSSLP